MAAARRTRNTERTRQSILDAAAELFVNERYDAVSVRRIAEKAQISHGTIYIHFKDKDDLLYQVSEERFSRLLSRLRRLPRSRDPLRRLEDALLEIIRFGLDHPNDFQLMMGLQTTFGGPKSTNQWGPNAAQLSDFLEALVAEADEAGFIKATDPRVDTSVLVALAHGVVLTSVTEERDRDAAERVAARSVDLVLAGLRA